MSDLISRQAAIEAVNTALFPKINTAKDAEKALRNLPSAQPEITLESAIDYLHDIGWMQEHDRIMAESAPVVHAYWIGLDSDAEKYDDIKCSVCGKSFTVDAYRWCDIGFTESDLNYCPKCGAKMDEVSG